MCLLLLLEVNVGYDLIIEVVLEVSQFGFDVPYDLLLLLFFLLLLVKLLLLLGPLGIGQFLPHQCGLL